MTKELDYLDKILNYQPLTLVERTIIECIKEKIQRLEAIEKSEPSEALKMLDDLYSNITEEIDYYWKGYERCEDEVHKYDNDFDTIKQALIKSQEQEKVLEILKSKKYIPLDKINPRFWDNKKDYDEIVDYEFYLWICEEECEYVVKEEQKLTQEEFELLKRWLEDDTN